MTCLLWARSPQRPVTSNPACGPPYLHTSDHCRPPKSKSLRFWCPGIHIFTNSQVTPRSQEIFLFLSLMWTLIFTFLFKKAIEQVIHCHDAKCKRLKRVNKKTDLTSTARSLLPVQNDTIWGKAYSFTYRWHPVLQRPTVVDQLPEGSFQWEVTMETQNVYFSMF